MASIQAEEKFVYIPVAVLELDGGPFASVITHTPTLRECDWRRLQQRKKNKDVQLYKTFVNLYEVWCMCAWVCRKGRIDAVDRWRANGTSVVLERHLHAAYQRITALAV